MPKAQAEIVQMQMIRLMALSLDAAMVTSSQRGVPLRTSMVEHVLSPVSRSGNRRAGPGSPAPLSAPILAILEQHAREQAPEHNHVPPVCAPSAFVALAWAH